MIGIKVFGDFLQLSEDTSVSLNLVNPIFAEDKVIPGSYSLPFDIPFGEKSQWNSRILSNIDNTENAVRLRKVPAQLFIDGNLYKTGELVIGRYSEVNGTLTVNFKFGLTIIADDIKTKKMNEISSEEVVLADNVFTKRVLICANTESFDPPFSIIINGRTYSASNNGGLASAINADTTEPRVKAIYHNTPYNIPGYGTLISSDYFTIEPYDPAAALLVETPLTVKLPEGTNYLELHIDTIEFQAAYNAPLVEWLNDNVNDPRFRFPMIRNGKLYGDEKVKYLPALGNPTTDHNFSNFNDDTGFKLNEPNFYEEDLIFGAQSTFVARNYTSIQPFLRLSWMMERAASYFAVGLEGDFLSTGEYQDAIFYHSNALDLRLPFIGEVDWIGTRRSFNTSEFAPDITFLDLLKEIQTRFCVSIYYNESTRKIRLQTRRSIIESPAFTDITSICSPPREKEDIGLNGIRVQGDRDKDDESSVDDYYESGSVEDVIKTSLVGLGRQETFTLYKFGLSPGSSIYSLPVSSRLKSTKIPLVLFFYTGVQSSGGTIAVNYPSANINHPSGVFQFSGATGMVARRWKNWLRFLLLRKEVELDISFELRHLNVINWESKVMIDRVKYLYKSISVKFTSRKIEASKVTVYKS